jgi:hypothetical protein
MSMPRIAISASTPAASDQSGIAGTVAAPQHWSSMAPFLYRCPNTGLNVQGWFADNASEEDEDTYETVTCLACTRAHLINRSTGKVLGE